MSMVIVNVLCIILYCLCNIDRMQVNIFWSSNNKNKQMLAVT